MRSSNSHSRPIFRDVSVRRYAERHDKTVLPRLVTPGTFLYLWLALAVLLGCSLLTYRKLSHTAPFILPPPSLILDE